MKTLTLDQLTQVAGGFIKGPSPEPNPKNFHRGPYTPPENGKLPIGPIPPATDDDKRRYLHLAMDR